MYLRTGDMMTKGYTDGFINKYIGPQHIEAYKTTDIYTLHYDSILREEAKLPCVADVVKHQYIDKDKMEEIFSQKHLLSKNDLVAVVLSGFSDKVSKIYCVGGLLQYYTNIDTIRKSRSWSSEDFNKFKTHEKRYNQPYDEAFISILAINGETYFIEHNEEFGAEEITELRTSGAESAGEV